MPVEEPRRQNGEGALPVHAEEDHHRVTGQWRHCVLEEQQ